jgi:cell division protein FtsB
MFDFQQKRKIRKVIYSKMFFVVLLILIAILAKATYEIYKKESLSSESLNETQKELGDLKSRQSMLNSEISKLNTDSGIEEEIRSKFDVAKPGETVVVVVGANTSSSENDTSSNAGFWQTILNLFTPTPISKR